MVVRLAWWMMRWTIIIIPNIVRAIARRRRLRVETVMLGWVAVIRVHTLWQRPC